MKKLKSRNLSFITFLIITALLVFLLVPYSFAAFEKKVYDPVTKTITIKSLFNSPIVDLQLLENTDNCLIDCHAIIKITPHADFDAKEFARYKFDFFDNERRDALAVGKLRDWDLKRKVIKDYYIDVSDYGECSREVCVEDNETHITECYDETYECIIGSHKELRQREEWKKFVLTPAFFIKGESVIIKIEGKKKPNANVEWLPTFYGFTLDEWAWWNTSWNNRKAFYVKETTGSGLTGLMLLINVTHNNMNVSFEDLRFTNTSDDELNYNITNKEDSSHADVLVNLSHLPANANTTFYIYYNNPSVETTSIPLKYIKVDSQETNTVGRRTLNAIGMGGADQFNVTSAYNCRRISLYLDGLGGSPKIIAQIWADDGNDHPDTVLKTIENKTIVSGWNNFTHLFGQSLSSGTPYWVSEIITAGTSASIYGTNGIGNWEYTDDGGSAWIDTEATNAIMYMIWKIDEDITSTYTWGDEESRIPITTTLNTPTDNSYHNHADITFNCSAKTNNSLINISLYGNFTGTWGLNETKNLTGTDNSTTFSKTLIETDYFWNCLAFNNLGNSSWDTSNYTLTIDLTEPVVSIVNPTGTYYSYTSPYNTSLDYVIDESNPDTCQYELDGASNVTISGCINISIDISSGSHNLTLYVKDLAENWGSDTNSFYINFINITQDYLRNTTESQIVNFTLAIETTNTTSFKSANFTYNHTVYQYDEKTVNGDTTTFRVNITVPLIGGGIFNIPFQWNYTVDSLTNFTALLNQTVYSFLLQLGWESDLYNTTALNISFYDEGNQSPIGADIDLTFVYWLYDRETNKTYSVVNESYHNYTFVISPSNETIYTDYTLYYSAIGYPQRRLYQNNLALTNVITQTKLYLLKAADGIYVRFQTVDAYQNPIADVRVTVEKIISGTYTTVEKSDTDDSGLATFWVNPDDDHRFTFTKTGYEQVVKTLRPTSPNIYSIVMGEEAEEEELPNWVGIDYEFYPKDSVLNNRTSYDFSFNLTSTEWEISSCVFWLQNSSGNTLSTTSGCTSVSVADFTLTYNTGNLSSITALANFTIDNSVSSVLTVRRDYSIVYHYKGEFSLMNVFDDIRDFVGGGFNDFTRALIGFVIIFSLVAIAGYYSGQYNPEGLLLLAMGLTWIFSFVGWFAMTESGIPFSFLEQYLIAIIITLLTATFIIIRRI